MWRHVRNASFLILLAVSLWSANARASFSCEEAESNCETFWVGLYCEWGERFCSEEEWTTVYTCEEDDDECGDPGNVYWHGECATGGSC